ncbi:MAG: siphovirus Gp157 family protein [Oscillospiraceae bacterium]|nr:siphovirus Gp157 family protein [Oscillospiraceae bacterium]
MTIYDIDQQMAALVDPETGELLDYDAFDALQMERETKIEDMALWYKNEMAEAAAIRAEEEALAERRKRTENRAERLKGYIDTALAGEKFKTSRVVCSFRASSAVEVDDEFVTWAEQYGDTFLRFKTPEVNKAAIAAAIKDGQTVPHATMVQRQNLSIK